MTLDQFIDAAKLDLEVFADSYREHSKTDPSFYPDRIEEDWWAEVNAYRRYVRYQEAAARYKNKRGTNEA